MPHPIMYHSEDTYVLLEANQPEQFLAPDELLAKLKQVLSDRQDDLPLDLQKFTNLDDQAKYLMESSCELDVGPDGFLQWYAVRLEK